MWITEPALRSIRTLRAGSLMITPREEMNLPGSRLIARMSS